MTCEKCSWYKLFEFEDIPMCTLHDIYIGFNHQICKKFVEKETMEDFEAKELGKLLDTPLHERD